MADEYITRYDAETEIAEIYSPYGEDGSGDTISREVALSKIRDIPAADVVSRDCYDKILWENDIMRRQLADVGKAFGEKMDDDGHVVRGRWIDERWRSKAIGLVLILSPFISVFVIMGIRLGWNTWLEFLGEFLLASFCGIATVAMVIFGAFLIRSD